jgi:hypothetical protein
MLKRNRYLLVLTMLALFWVFFHRGCAGSKTFFSIYPTALWEPQFLPISSKPVTWRFIGSSVPDRLYLEDACTGTEWRISSNRTPERWSRW